MAQPHWPTPPAVERDRRARIDPKIAPASRDRSPTRWRWARRIGIPIGLLVVAGLVVLAISQLDLRSVGHSLASAQLAWVAVALVLMSVSLALRAVSWHQTLQAAIPEASVGLVTVLRATVIGVMVSALLPGRIGEPSRSLIVSRRLGSARRFFTLVLGTVFSQTLINLFALVILAVVTFTQVPVFSGRETGLIAAVGVPIAVALLAVVAPRALRRFGRARSPRLRAASRWTTTQLTLVRQGLMVFARPRRGVPAVTAQLLAWVLQAASCYAVLLALHFGSRATPVTAAAILLAVNVSAILPATPSNVGVFQAACLAVLTAFGFGTAESLAYGILLQAIEVTTAIAMGIPGLLGEGMSWRELSDIRGLDRA